MSTRQEHFQLPGESLAQYADRLWHLIMCIEESSGESTLQLENNRMLLFVVEMQLLLEEEANFVRLPPITRESWSPQPVRLGLFL